MPKANSKDETPFVDVFELFLRSLTEKYPNDRLAPAVIISQKKNGFYQARVTRNISYNGPVETVVRCENASTANEALVDIIKQWQLMQSPSANATQQLLDLEF